MNALFHHRDIFVTTFIAGAPLGVVALQGISSVECSSAQVSTGVANTVSVVTKAESQSPTNNTPPKALSAEKSFVPPMDRAFERITKKHFGTFIIPGQSPVPNDRFWDTTRASILKFFLKS